MRPFARGYSTYADWVTGRADSKNVRWIRRKHSFFPDLTRNELETTPYKDLTVSWMRWEDLNPELRRGRVQAVQVLRLLRAGENFENVLEAQSMIEADAVCHLSPDYLWFEEGRQSVCYAPSDPIEVAMHLYERGEGIVSVVTTSSQDRSLIGKYMAAVIQAFESDETTPLADFIGKMVLDAYGGVHYFETDLDELYAIAEMQEEPEFFEIYSNGD